MKASRLRASAKAFLTTASRKASNSQSRGVVSGAIDDSRSRLFGSTFLWIRRVTFVIFVHEPKEIAATQRRVA
jgi:hypothetical protein